MHNHPLHRGTLVFRRFDVFTFICFLVIRWLIPFCRACGENGRFFRAEDETMKVVLMIIGSLGGLYAVAGGSLFIRTMITSDPGTAYGGSTIAASVLPLCLGLIVCIACFQKAFQKPKL